MHNAVKYTPCTYIWAVLLLVIDCTFVSENCNITLKTRDITYCILYVQYLVVIHVCNEYKVITCETISKNVLQQA